MIELTVLKVLMLMKQFLQNSLLFATFGILQIKDLSFNLLPVMFIDLISIAILNIDGIDFCYITDAINK